MMKKILAVFLVVCILLSGCGAGGNKPTEGSENKKILPHKGISIDDGITPTLSAAMGGKKYDLTAHWLTDEKKTLRISTYDAVNNTYLPPSNEEWFWQALEEYTNVHVEWDISPYAGYDEVINTRLAAGINLGDIMMSNGVRPTQNAGNNGIFIDLKPYWDTCFTNTTQYFQNVGIDLFSYIENPDGRIYSIPNILNPTEGHITFLYNTDWLEELGVEVPTTLDEFTDLMYKMQEAGDLNHNGFDDEICLTSASLSILMSVLGNAFNLEQYEGWEAFGADAEGTVYAEYTTENMKQCLKYLHQLYSDGILDNEIFYANADDMGEKIANDRVGCFVYYSGFAIGYGRLTSKGQADPLAECYSLGLPLASQWNNNEGYFVYRTFAYGNTGAAITSECADPELAAKWLDTLYADPNIMWIRCYGKEGETFRFNESDGGLELICNDTGEWDARYLGGGQLALPFIQTSEEMISDKLSYDWYLDEYDQMRQCKWVEATVPKTSIFTSEEMELRDAVNSEVTSYWYEWRDKFVSGIADVDTQWDTYVNSINSLGLTRLVTAWQMVYDRLENQ